MMKKTLVALAAVAVTGGAMAQAVLTGELAYGYSTSTTGAGSTTSGGGMDTSTLKFTTSEDLGNGNSVGISLATDGTSGRGGSMKMDDQSITLKMSGVTMVAGSTKPGDWLTGVTGGATWYGLDGKVLSSRSYKEKVGISFPVAEGVTASVTAYGPAGVVEEGTGNGGSSAQSSTVYNLAYKAGALSVQGGYVAYTNRFGTDSTTRTVSRVGGNYDLGVAKIGAGFSSADYDGGGTNSQTMVSASAPLGVVSVNAEWASTSTTSALLTTAGTRTGYVLGAQYNFSPRTYAILNYRNYLDAVGDAQNTTTTALTLVHDF